ncbi:uncharacterized protein TRAVEDRAFT_31879 [Trametes versicolor FP-101664 SS1]|uniref:uncharacterized protein n=1 Tax=Trametes versicolor (strain FP-101664) TaxID=717944 RepID=UPI000462222B|nr:uncharacterized protein TRAVEDRAFT_31879 [Trametes versicolor FP-101664 SS1]EIW52815.1 hypothetical protein TRAVEDRAFT_31879 [Trametes versicolor FP-101664 SS1]
MRYDSIVRRYCTTTPGPTVHRKVARTIVQSEAVYSASILAQLVLYLTHSTYFLVAGYIFPPLVGISFTLIITHVGFDDIMGQLEEVDRPERGF